MSAFERNRGAASLWSRNREVSTTTTRDSLSFRAKVRVRCAFSLLERTIAIFTNDVGKNDLIVSNQYNEALGYIEAVKRKMERSGLTAEQVNEFFHIRARENPYENKLPIKICTFRPAGPLSGGPGGLTFDATEMKGMVREGEATANDFIAALNPEDITWA